METQTELQSRLKNREIEEHYENTPTDFVDYLRFNDPVDSKESERTHRKSKRTLQKAFDTVNLGKYDHTNSKEREVVTKDMLALAV